MENLTKKATINNKKIVFKVTDKCVEVSLNDGQISLSTIDLISEENNYANMVYAVAYYTYFEFRDKIKQIYKEMNLKELLKGNEKEFEIDGVVSSMIEVMNAAINMCKDDCLIDKNVTSELRRKYYRLKQVNKKFELMKKTR